MRLLESGTVAPKPTPTLVSHDLARPLRRTSCTFCCVRLLRRKKRKKCPNLRPIDALGTTPVPRHLLSVKSVSDQVRPAALRSLAYIYDKGIFCVCCCCCYHTGHFTYECKDTRPYVSRPSRTAQLQDPQLLVKSKAADGNVDVPEEFKNKFVPFLGTHDWRLILTHLIGVGLRIGFWRQRRSKERERRRRRIERRNERSGMFAFPLPSIPPFFSVFYRLPQQPQSARSLLMKCVCCFSSPGHQVHPSLLNPIQVQSPSPSPNHRRARIQLQQTRIVHGHAREKEMRSGGGHEGAASHANHLVIETTAVAVQGADACGLVAMLPPFEGFLHRVCVTKYLPATLCIAFMELFVKIKTQTDVAL